MQINPLRKCKILTQQFDVFLTENVNGRINTETAMTTINNNRTSITAKNRKTVLSCVHLTPPPVHLNTLEELGFKEGEDK